jgi:hypothetical protein
MTQIASLIKKFAQNKYVETYKGCDEAILNELSAMLIKSGHAWSEDLSRFYQISNGFFFNGIYIFSMGKDDAHPVPNLLAQNVQWNISERLPGGVLFGRSDEEVFVFNQPENKYQILDFTGWDEYYAFDSLAGLFEFVVNERL